jgi:hypothetical protein
VGLRRQERRWEVLEGAGISYDVLENKHSYWTLPMICRKNTSFKRKELAGFLGSKKGGPKNEGISYDVYENKERKKVGSGKSYDVIENKQVIPSILGCL